MCGIAGIFNFGSLAPADPVALARATAAMVHRGPDDEGFYIDGELGLGNRRLSIIDLPGGHQPISNEDGTVWITFNGEIYNYRDLRQDLETRGHHFRTASDTEAIVHLYEEYGLDGLHQLRGMFAFALWDGRRRRLWVARDRIGVKPLFYRLREGTLQFASELRALAELDDDGGRFEVDPQAVYDFFAFRYVPAPGTFYQGVQKLLPGHYLLADRAGVRTMAWWDVPVEEEGDAPDCNAVASGEQAIELLRESVRLRLIADVPVGVFLSGGIDSSAVVALAAELGARPLRTFSVGFDEAPYSELPAARETARAFQTEHEELVLRAADLAADLEHLVAFRHEPVSEATDVALHRIAQQAARTVKVVLAGEGGDEVFAGYPKYAADRLARWVSIFPPPVTRSLARLLPYGARRLQLALETLAIRGDAERSTAWFASFTGEERQALFAPEFLAEIDPAHPARVFAEYLERAPGRSPLKRLLYADLKIWLPDNLLLRGDQMTMAASIEERVPFLDHKLVEFAARIPERWLTEGFKTKAFLKRALAPYLSADTLHRHKVGFKVPVGDWFRGPLKSMVGDLVLSPEALGRGYFDRRAMQQFVREHFDGVRDRHKQLWALVNFELWQRSVVSSQLAVATRS
ncbi:MAG TPA: asparagine synthase (glutamine-hydrolyzing) [Terriglobia bacterium]|nr:asparagine synthase (glutamine-hydrolyzing) [Terriglobia bacterium]